MATLNIFDEFLLKNNFEFQSFYKELMNEMVDVQELGDVLMNSLKKSVNSTRYWSKKLEKFTNAKTIIFTMFSPEPFKHAAYLEIFKALSEVIELSSIKEIYQPENPRYIGLVMESKEKADFVLENFKKVGSSFIIFTNWLAEAHVYKGRLHWLQNDIDLSIINGFLNKFFTVKSISKAQTVIAKDFIINTNVIIFEGLLKFGVNISEVPHLMKFGNNDALITIKGRPPLCLGCNKIGHTKMNCDYAYCAKCKLVCLKSHSCQDFVLEESYATVLKMTERCGDKSIKSDDLVSSPPQNSVFSSAIDGDWINVKRPNARPASKVTSTLTTAGGASPSLQVSSKVVDNVVVGNSDNQLDSDLYVPNSNDSVMADPPALRRKRHAEDCNNEISRKAGDYNFEKSVRSDTIVTMNTFEVLSDESGGFEK